MFNFFILYVNIDIFHMLGESLSGTFKSFVLIHALDFILIPRILLFLYFSVARCDTVARTPFLKKKPFCSCY